MSTTSLTQCSFIKQVKLVKEHDLRLHNFLNFAQELQERLVLTQMEIEMQTIHYWI